MCSHSYNLFGNFYCTLWLGLSYPFTLSNIDRILLLSMLVVNVILIVQVIKNFRNVNKK